MPAAANMNYDTLTSDIESYLERYNDTRLATQIPRLIMMAENRVATDMKILGFQKVVTGAFVAGNPAVVKPAYWRNTISWNYTDPDVGRVELLKRQYEYCRNYWPDSSAQARPRFYADYNFDNFLVVGTPNAALPFELVYYARLDPLSSASQINWMTANAPQLLLFACLLEAEIWLKNYTTKAARQEDYSAAMSQLKSENGKNAIDRGIVVS